jgi:hypothetical protein
VTTATQRNSELARARRLAERSGLAWIDLDAELVDPIAATTLSLPTMAEALAVPYALEGRTLKVVLARLNIAEVRVASPTVTATTDLFTHSGCAQEADEGLKGEQTLFVEDQLFRAAAV